ncbi:MAG: MFS transporter [Ilumatobacter sp.]
MTESVDVVDDEHVDGHPRRWQILVICCGGLFMIVSALTSLNVALPALSADLGASTSDLQWIIDAYGIVFGGLLLTGGAIGDRIGRRRALVVGFAVIALGGLLGGMSDSVAQVVVARVVGGLGAALLMPATLSTISDVFSTKDRAQAIATWSGVAGAGGAFGPAIGGWLVDSASWTAVFWLNAAMAVVGVVAVLVVVPNLAPAHAGRLDPVGSVLSTGAIGLAVLAIIEAPSKGFAVIVVVPAVAAVALGIAFVRHQGRTSDPMLPLVVFDSRERRAGLWTLVAAAIGFAGVIFVGSLFLQIGWGESALVTGLLLVPIGVAELAVSSRCPRLSERFGSHRVVAAGLVAMSIGYIGMAIVPVGDRTSFVIAGIVAGVGNGLTIPVSVERVVSRADPELAGVVAGLNETAIEIGASLGIALLGGVQRIVFGWQLPSGASSDDLTAAIDEVGEAVAVDAFTDGTRWAFGVAAVAVLVVLPVAARRHGAED